MPAIILAHPRSPVVFDPREPPHPPQYDMPTEEQWQRLEGIDATRRLCEQYGYARVARWVRNLAALDGRALDENISNGEAS
jgi:hypothetical protein